MLLLLARLHHLVEVPIASIQLLLRRVCSSSSQSLHPRRYPHNRLLLHRDSLNTTIVTSVSTLPPLPNSQVSPLLPRLYVSQHFFPLSKQYPTALLSLRGAPPIFLRTLLSSKHPSVCLRLIILFLSNHCLTQSSSTSSSQVSLISMTSRLSAMFMILFIISQQ